MAKAAKSNRAPTPRVWTKEELENDIRSAIEAFVNRRLTEPQEEYPRHIEQRRKAFLNLVRALSSFELSHPNPDMIRKVLFDDALFDTLRYVAGPPVSEDDLYTLVSGSPDRIGKRALEQNDELVESVLRMICRLADDSRFPWLREKRAPKPFELKMAIRTTSAIHAAQSMQTARRGYGRKVEALLKVRLAKAGFKKVEAPNGGVIDAPDLAPAPGTFYGECMFYSRRADVLIGVGHGRLVAVESKDSSSGVNSIKRVANDPGSKAKHWKDEHGKQVFSVALLPGVFKSRNLMAAQESGLYLVWAHDLEDFVFWLESSL